MPLLNAADSVRLGSASADRVYLGGALVWQGSAPELNALIFPLTYDELDATNSLSLTRSGGSGPHVTPDGFEGDGYEARYTYAALPSFVNAGGPLTMAATIAAPMVRNNSPRTDVVALTKNTVNGAHRMGISIVTDTSGAVTGAVALVVGSSQQVLGRPGWRYERRVPVLSANGGAVKPQGLLCLDAGTLLFSVHFSDTESRVYKMRLSDKAILGEFTFGTATYRHVAAFAMRSNGEVWAGDYETGTLLQLDLDASFASGQASILKAINCSDVQGFGAIEFATIAAQEYLLAGTYNTADLSGYLYLYDVSLLAGTSIGSSQEYRRYTIGRRVQGLAMREGALLVSRNSKYGGSVTGVIERFNLAGMVADLATNTIVGGSNNTQYITGEWVAPSSYPEDLAVHPLTGEVFTSSEGAYTVADTVGFLAVWSSTLSTSGATNHYAVEFDGNQTVSVKVNNQPFVDLNWILDTTAAVLTIGGPPQQAPGFAAGYSWAKVSNVLLQDGALAPGQYDALTSGGYEPNTLTAYEVALVNPGAETGDTSGWTVESGGMGVRAANPPPLSGAWYFSGGSFVQSVSRQRVALSAAGVPTAAVDNGEAWVKLRWGQSAYSDQDPGTMGVRALSSSDATLATTYAPAAYTPGGGGASGPWYWFPRSAAVSLPTGARKVDVLYNAAGRTSGTNNDFYVDDISAVVYSTAAPQPSGDPYWANVVALLHFDAGFSDVKGGTVTLTGTPTIDTSVFKFGEGSAAFSGSGQRAYVNADFNVGTEDFTIEFFYRPAPNAGSQDWIFSTAYVAAGWLTLGYAASQDRFNWFGTNLSNETSIDTFAKGVWHHVAISRSAGMLRMYVNGVLQRSLAHTVNFAVTGVYFGGTDSNISASSSWAQGHIDELRITKGVGRYTADFTPPDKAFPNG